MLGLNMLLAGPRPGFSRRVSTRRELKQARHQAGTLHEERDTLAHQLVERVRPCQTGERDQGRRKELP